MPLRRQYPPCMFGRLVGCMISMLLTPNCFQVIFRRDVQFGDALKCWHSVTPKKRGRTNCPLAGKPREDGPGRYDEAAYLFLDPGAVLICSIRKGFSNAGLEAWLLDWNASRTGGLVSSQPKRSPMAFRSTHSAWHYRESATDHAAVARRPRQGRALRPPSRSSSQSVTERCDELARL
jgi:hypothetical protein